ncbi:hypothetical protein BM477_01440 [Boudabousia marimammalium]|uniref:DEAD/DEAH box helicase n=2 Tax=Boudabousia marimammalium TaxID=156892 RepID=A0A1Q5PSX9_9ACTO|nr:hypothetical protein BM477_01440 [Boudabousia marimammalium]
MKRLEAESAGDDRLVQRYEIPPRPPRFSPWPEWVPGAVREAYLQLGVEQPWSHQAQAADLAYAGQPTVVATGTGSGKSMAAWLPILSELTVAQSEQSTRISAVRHRPTALYMSPTKALAADQLQSLLGVIAAPPQPLPVLAGICDGDASREMKQWARAQADIVITNPDYLHHVLLAGHPYWVRLLRSLRYVIVDEIHSYKGVMGANMALVTRRLLRLARHYGADPTVIALSATIKDAQQVFARFLGVAPERVQAVTEDGSPAGSRHFVLWQPKIIDFGAGDGSGEFGAEGAPPFLAAAEQLLREREDEATWALTGVMPGSAPDDDLDEILGITSAEEDAASPARGMEFQRRSLNLEAAWVSATALLEGAKTLTFVRSRVGAEQVAKLTRRELRINHSALADAVAAYRGGFLPEERRELERQIRVGELHALATTNALELGVDISGLDVTVTAGWPGTRASLWQQTGRAGRAGSGGVSVFVASENPLDSYLIHHPDAIFQEVEQSTFNAQNPYVLGPHLCAAAAELPLTEADLPLFGLTDDKILRQLAERTLLAKRPAGWYWNATLSLRAHELADLRGLGGNIQVVEEESGTVIGSVDEASAHRLLHPGAIYTHQAKAFEVRALTDSVALVRPFKQALTTRPTERTSVEITDEVSTWRSEDDLVTWHWGATYVLTQVTDYDVLRTPRLQFVVNRKLDLPARTLDTASTWFTLDPSVPEALGLDAASLPGALHAAEHAMIGMLPLLAICDRADLGGLSTVSHTQTAVPTVFVHDAVAGGAGFSRSGLQQARSWVEKTLRTVEECPCEMGCPACIQSPKCGNNNDPLNKEGAIKVLRFLLPRTPGPDRFDPSQ